MQTMEQRKGYAVTVTTSSCFYIPHAEHIEKIDEFDMFEDDEDACGAAEKDGVKLIYGMNGVPDGVYLDTPENRDIIAKSLQKWPEYKQ